METGRMVVLLNLHNLYESLYDLLNQVGIWVKLSLCGAVYIICAEPVSFYVGLTGMLTPSKSDSQMQIGWKSVTVTQEMMYNE